MAVKFTDSSLEDFVKLVRRAIFLTPGEEAIFNAIPDQTWSNIFETNFNGNLSYASRALLKQFRDIERIDKPRVEAETRKIANLDKAAKTIADALARSVPVVFVTDVDNDGSFSQSIVREYLKLDVEAAKGMQIEYAQVLNGNSARGITVDVVDKILKYRDIDPSGEVLLITADNGINSRDEQVKIQAKFPKAKLIVTDHHLPDPGLVVREDERTIIFNPHHNPTDFYKRVNISGAATVGVLMRRLLEERLPKEEIDNPVSARILGNMSNLARIANLLDYVHSDPMDKPEKDYVVSKFLQIQGLMNVNNSLNKIIVNGLPRALIRKINDLIPDLDPNVLREEARNIQTQNLVAKVLLKMFHENHENAELNGEDFNSLFLREINDPENFQPSDDVNPNYIEQLRPLIFQLSVDEEKSAFLDRLCDNMVQVFKSIQTSEKAMASELRKGSAVTRNVLPNSSITYADPVVLQAFNRKFLGKVYNDENPGFNAMLDNVGRSQASGSFRSLYDISEILPEADKVNLELRLGVRIETPGHERAAGFIIKSADPETMPIDDGVIEEINKAIDANVAKLKAAEPESNSERLLTDLSAIHLIDRINKAIRGNISNFERIVPLLKLTPDTVWTDSYTTEQLSMKDVVDRRKYGYISINTDFHGGTVILPVELVRRIVDNGYKDYVSINYMDEGVFMAERVVPEKLAGKLIDLRGSNDKSRLIDETFSTYFSDKNLVELTRDQIKDNPFYKYHDFGDADFNLFERMVISVIDSHGVDVLSVFDVEANGFGNGKLMNFGAMNYQIVEGSGTSVEEADFKARLFHNRRGEEFLLDAEQIAELREITAEEKKDFPLEIQKKLLMHRFADGAAGQDHAYYHPALNAKPAKPGTRAAKAQAAGLVQVTNHAFVDGKAVYNRTIKADMLAYLVRDNDFKVPQEMTNLTGITQELLDKHGKKTSVVDAEIAAHYKGKKVLFGAHNTPYDSRIMRANAPEFYSVLRQNLVYDSAIFCKEYKLAYDEVRLANFREIDGIPASVFFYHNERSDFSLGEFLKSPDDGYYPDRTGNYLLSKENGAVYFVDKVKHETIRLGADAAVLQEAMAVQAIPNTAVKYSVEKLSEQWMVHALMLSDEKFDIQHVDLSDPKYASLRVHEAGLIHLQDNYLFDAAADTNIANFRYSYYYARETEENQIDSKILEEFVEEFLSKNSAISEKFSNSWMYKRVLEIKDPSRAEVTNDLVDLVHFQTHLPKTKIRSIYAEAIAFKEKYKIDHILQHEGHVNGPFEGDAKGDVAFEDKLTFSLLARRMYNPYASDIGEAVNRFNQAAVKARLAFDLSHHLSDSAAHDSYSYRQGLLYERDISSPMISGIQSREAQLAEDEEHVVKFKLSNDVLPPETSVVAVVRKGVELSRKEIVADAGKFDFILVNEQVRNSLDNIPSGNDRSRIESILEANEEVCIGYKQDLSARYRFVEVNRREGQIKKLVEWSIKSLRGKGSRPPKQDAFFDMLPKDFDIVLDIVKSHVDLQNRTREPMDESFVEQTIAMIEGYKELAVPPALQNALQNPGEAFRTFSELRDPNFLREVDIKRMNPVKTVLEKHPSLRVSNRIIQAALPEMAFPVASPRQKMF